MGNRYVNEWTDARIEQLKALCKEGLSYGDIARRMNCGFTRNAVLGKAARLKLPVRPKSGSLQRAKPAPKVKISTPRVYAPRNVHAEAPLEIDGRHVTLMQLNDRMCKFPIGDPTEKSFHFCGHKPFPGRPYCEAHCRTAYQRMMPRREEHRGREK